MQVILPLDAYLVHHHTFLVYSVVFQSLVCSFLHFLHSLELFTHLVSSILYHLRPGLRIILNSPIERLLRVRSDICHAQVFGPRFLVSCLHFVLHLSDQ